MSTVNDAQRLVSISLGKLAVSRSQRGGPQLHKALLLSTVLYKAREVYMMENKAAQLERQSGVPERSRMLERQCSVNDQEVPQSVEPTEPITINSQAPEIKEEADETKSTPTESSPLVLSRCERNSATDDKENSMPQQIPSGYTHPLPGNTGEEKSDCDNKNLVVKVKKCEKRGISQDREDCAVKRMRLVERPLEQSDNCTEQNARNEPVPMDCVQISSLVSRFNSGLSGCLSSQNQCSDADEENTIPVSSKSISCCRTVQVKEGFESFQRSAISLTV